MKLSEYLKTDRGVAVKVAKKAGVSLSTVTRCARGETSPKRKVAIAISEACEGNVSVDEVYGDCE